MNRTEIFYQNYLAEQQSDAFQFCRETGELNAMYGFLRFRLDPDDFLEAECLLNELLAIVQREGFYAGIAYFPNLFRELIAE